MGRGDEEEEMREPSLLSDIVSDRSLCIRCSGLQAQLITSLMNVKATDFTVSRKTDVKQILCLAVERHILQSGPYSLGSFGVLALADHANFWTKVTSVSVFLKHRRGLGDVLKDFGAVIW